MTGITQSKEWGSDYMPSHDGGSWKSGYRGFCLICKSRYEIGDFINRYSGRYAHAECRDSVVEKGRIMAGETYRAQAPSSWRRKKPPNK